MCAWFSDALLDFLFSLELTAVRCSGALAILLPLEFKGIQLLVQMDESGFDGFTSEAGSVK